MNPDKLLDAFGMIDDRFLVSEKKVHAVPLRKRLLVLIAAILVFMLFVGTAMAVSKEFQELIFSIFSLQTHEQPPAANTDILPTEDGMNSSQSGLQEIDKVSIDGIVHAHYFTSDGIVLTREGGFYTCAHRDADAVPDDAAFWEIRADEIVNVGATRIEFPLTHGDRTLQIIFDYAILNGKLSIKVWPQNMDEDPVGNGWNIEPIGNRTDIALLTVPVDIGLDDTHDFFLLDLATLETIDLLGSIPHDTIIPHDTMVIDAGWVTDDLHYMILMCFNYEKGGYEYWVCDLERNTITALADLTETTATKPYFLDESTIIFQEALGRERFNVVSHHIPTGVQNVIVENTILRSGDNPGYRGIQMQGGHGAHGLLFREDGSVDLIDLHTRVTLNMTGLDTDKLTTSESPDGTRIMIAYEEENESGYLGYGFSELGVLNPETGVLQMLTREISGDPESFWGWLNNNTLVVTAHDAAGKYYVYVYDFQEQNA